MRLRFYQDNIGEQFPVLWEGYSESVGIDKQRVFGYTPNYLKVACVIGKDKSLENKTTLVSLMLVGDKCILADQAG